MELARAQIEKTKIVAPFSGIVGLRRVSVGEYITPGQALVGLDAIDRIKVDFKVPENRLGEVYRLIAQINEQLWLGHFDLWTQEGLIMFRQGLMLNGAIATAAQCEALLRAALEACERYYQSFQFVVWAGRESREALASTMFETQGQA